jgi:pimeloyl-ACP methyl ester carboxylesterase
MKIRSIAGKAGKIFLYASSIIAGAFSIGSVLSAWMMVKPGRKKSYDCVGRVAFGKLEPLSLMASDGIRLHAWMQLSLKATSNRWVLLLHGYRSNRNILHTRRRFFVRRGYHVLLLHFRGHGSSQAANISYGFNERLDVKAAMDFIRSLDPGRPLQIGIDGVSMGAAAAAYAVAYESITPNWVILESCYNDIHQALANRLKEHVSDPLIPVIARPLEFVGEHVFGLPMENLNPARALEKIQCPVLVLAGDSEKVLNAEEVERLFLRIPEPKRLVFFPGAVHEDLLLYDPRRFAGAVADFLREFVPPLSAGHELEESAAAV